MSDQPDSSMNLERTLDLKAIRESVKKEPAPDLEPLTCAGCERQVDPMGDSTGWVLVQHSVDEGDDDDDQEWKCPDCATASDEFYGVPRPDPLEGHDDEDDAA